MQHIFHHAQRLDIKILAWILSCLIIGALLAMIIIDPNSDEKAIRRSRNIRPTLIRRPGRNTDDDEDNFLESP